MRTKLANNEVPHEWFYNSANYKGLRIGAENLFFEGDTIYSYGYHFSIAKKFPGNIILFSNGSYSVTTTKHMFLVRSAIPNHYTVIHVPNPNADSKREHKQNYVTIRDTFKALREQIAKGRGVANQYRIERLNDSIEELNQYTKIFKLGYKQIPSFVYDKDEAAKTKKKLAIKAKKLAIKAKKEREQKLLKNRAAIKDWQNGIINYLPHYAPGTYLRLKESDKSVVETSRGASMPLKHALLLFKYVTKHRGESLPAKQFGTFSLTRMNASGDITIGCHNIGYEEMERLFNSLKGE